MVNEGPPDYIDKQIQNYTVVSKLTDGGSAHVYLAHNNSGERVAIKVLNKKYLYTKTQRLFLREIQTLRYLKGLPHIISILGHGADEGVPYIILEYAPGGTLRELINNFGSLKTDHALAILMQVGEALHSMHLHGFVHNDLKPENILLDNCRLD